MYSPGIMLSVPFSKEAAFRKRGSVRRSSALVKSKRPLNLMRTQPPYILFEPLRTTDEKFATVEVSVPILKELLRRQVQVSAGSSPLAYLRYNRVYQKSEKI